MEPNSMAGSGIAADMVRDPDMAVWYQIEGKDCTEEEYRAWVDSFPKASDIVGPI